MGVSFPPLSPSLSVDQGSAYWKGTLSTALPKWLRPQVVQGGEEEEDALVWGMGAGTGLASQLLAESWGFLGGTPAPSTGAHMQDHGGWEGSPNAPPKASSPSHQPDSWEFVALFLQYACKQPGSCVTVGSDSAGVCVAIESAWVTSSQPCRSWGWGPLSE